MRVKASIMAVCFVRQCSLMTAHANYASSGNWSSDADLLNARVRCFRSSPNQETLAAIIGSTMKEIYRREWTETINTDKATNKEGQAAFVRTRVYSLFGS